MNRLLSILVSLLFVSTALGAGVVLAEQQSTPKFSLPKQAKKISGNVYYLGKVDHAGKQAEGFAFIDKRQVPTKPGTTCGNNICEKGENKNNCSVDCGNGGNTGSADTSSCYGFMAKGAKWKSLENWVVNVNNPVGLSSNNIFNTLQNSVSTWEDAADGSLDGNVSFDIIGNGSVTSNTLVADTQSPDNKNEIYFADITLEGAVGVTIVWGYFSGNPNWRELIEWDQIYDVEDYDWSTDCDSNDCTAKMDFPSVAIHELGHSLGLNDLYNSECSEATMYGYVGFGDTNSRSLEAGDINGVSELY